MIVYILIPLIALFYFVLKYKHSYWTRRKITQDNPRFIFGSVDQKIFGSGNPTEYVKKAYWDLKKKGAKHGGIYLFYNPVWIPIDLKLIKQVLVTDYDYFSSHGFFHHKKDCISDNLFSKEGDEWKVLRSHLSPTFTPSKLKNMYDILYKFGHRMEERISDSCKKCQPINIRDTTTSYLIHVTASCFFGIESNSLDDPNSEFKHYGKLIAQSRPLRFLLESIVNWDLLAHLGYSFFPWAVKSFFTSLIKNVTDEREKNGVTRKDCLDTLVEMSKNGGPLTFQDVVATSTFLYAAGYETSSSTLSYLMYELAKNQDVQDNLRSEILSICKDNVDSEITYEDLSKMKYADMCLAEILRCYPALAQLPRACTKEYRIPGTDQVIEKGTTILIPVWAIQNDPEYFRNPTKFDPENMSPENQTSHAEDAWFAFGYGPRLCLGYKFAQMQIKVALVKYLKNHKFKLNIATPEKLTFKYDTVVLYPAEDIILDIEAIN